ncbi:hypothetical protein SISSUDRAFT_1056519 [Sistotremastrum suecicum HHB10207 ss-3]|uniref:Uncharacterized protein n=1 Tax=Sistotremastrum suecicum HHB10207 ss-3 TaxID=1314776 RepID=A0A165WP65_9AGAM|nr:hypothetical protein SISSUDRAFT_1056519 [Sistotremastrum suecicum HHB10207 ss-3]
MANTTITCIFNSRLHQIAPLLVNAVISRESRCCCSLPSSKQRSPIDFVVNTAGLL